MQRTWIKPIRRSGYVFWGILASLMAANVVAQVPLYTLHVQPKQCVSLHQGQTCYLTIDLAWQAPQQSDYCVYISGQTLPLKCWQNTQKGQLSKDWSTNKNLLFELRKVNSSEVLAKDQLKVSWVYKKQQKSRLAWRLF